MSLDAEKSEHVIFSESKQQEETGQRSTVQVIPQGSKNLFVSDVMKHLIEINSNRVGETQKSASEMMKQRLSRGV